METEELILKVNEFVQSPKFLSMTKREQDNFIRNGIPIIIATFAGIKTIEYLTNTLELDKLNRELELVNLELLWNKK